MSHPPTIGGAVLAAGSSAGFSAAALWEFLREVNWGSTIALVGSVASTAVAYYISRRAELTRAEIERQHLVRQAARDEDLADVLNRLKIREAEAKPAAAAK